MPSPSEYSIDDLARLAFLDLETDEREVLNQNLGDILNFFEAINDVDVSQTSAPQSINFLSTVSRSDTIKPSQDLKQVLEPSPSANAGYIKVPKVLE